MKLSQLRFFCAVFEYGTITAAAERLCCVPSNITMRIRELEGLAGVPLFRREKNRLLVTAEGRLMYLKAKEVIDRVEGVEQLFHSKNRVGVLNVGALDVALSHHMPRGIVDYRQRMPGIELNVYSGHSFDLEHRLIKGTLDLIITDGPIEHPLLTSTFAFREHLKLITPRQVRLVSPENLVALELYVFGKGCFYRNQAEDWLQRSGVVPRAILEVESYPIILACVAAGCGVACVPQSVLLGTANDRFIRTHPLEMVVPSDMYFVWRKDQDAELVGEFVEIVSGGSSPHS